MHDRGVRQPKTDGDRWLAVIDARFAAIDSRFDRLEALIAEEGVATRRHIDVFAEQFRANLRLMVEGCYSRLDNHERRIQALEKRRR